MRKLFFILLCITLATAGYSQEMGSDYRTAVGVKFYPGSISVKHFVADNKAVEGLAYFWQYGTRITGLYELHYDISSVEGLKWYIGPGAHIGFWNASYNDRYGSSGAYFGIDGVIGLDYKVKNAPLNLSLDWQPSWSFGSGGRTGFEGGWGGLGIRFAF